MTGAGAVGGQLEDLPCSRSRDGIDAAGLVPTERHQMDSFAAFFQAFGEFRQDVEGVGELRKHIHFRRGIRDVTGYRQVGYAVDDNLPRIGLVDDVPNYLYRRARQGEITVADADGHE
ncbi:hypothetical protein OHB12_20210 [Nocardia sp. NBC_01730]|uniref:hypothetical protein n=1 Tax=Nocardia sp. NBC_01730 TaxID=2975998 RepID=UPI002E12AB42|nr:hypothetical protein OHB12_20210 [Nocardia sp. NBC_01730]